MQIINNAIKQIADRHIWIGSLLRRMEILYDMPGLRTMATNGKQVIINTEFAKSLTPAEVKGVLVHEALHVINRHPLRRYDRDPVAFNVACDHAINGTVKALGYTLPEGALEPWQDLHYEDKTAEQIYSSIWPEMEEQREQQMQEIADAIAEALESESDDSGNSEAEGAPSSDGTEAPTGSKSDESGSEEQESGNSADSGDSESDGESDDSSDGNGSDANSECNSDSEPAKGNPGNANDEGGADLMDYPLEPGQTMADAEREMDTMIAAARMDAVLSCGRQPGTDEVHIFERKDSEMDWIKELEEYMQRIGGSDYSMRPPNKRLASAGIIANRLNPAGCGNVVMVVDTSGSIDTDQLNLVLTNLELFMENIDFETLRVIACESRVRYDETFMRGETFDISRMPIGGGTKFNPAFELVAEGAAPDLLIYFSDMQVYAHDAPEIQPEYPVLWVTDNSYSIDGDTGMFSECGSDTWFRPQWGDIIDTMQ